MDYMEKAWEASQKIVSAFAEARYIDKYGNVWLGVEGETRDKDHWVREDGLASTSSADMQKRMINHLMDWDEAPVEDPYEYAVETSRLGKSVTVFLDSDWGTKVEAESFLKKLTDSWVGIDYLTAKIVKRRKAGKIQDV